MVHVAFGLPANEYARIRQENDTLKEKIARQEAYMRRKMMKDKGKGDSFLSSAFADTKPLGEEDLNRGSHADFHTTPTAPSSMQQTMAHSPPSYKSRMFLREDKENHMYKGSMGAASSSGEGLERRWQARLSLLHQSPS